MLDRKTCYMLQNLCFFIYSYKYFMSANVIIMEFSKVLRKPTYCIMVSMYFRIIVCLLCA